MYITPEIAENIYRRETINNKYHNQKAIIFYLTDILKHRIELLVTSFPENTLHAVAIKTCDHSDVLAEIVQLGVGLEAASIEEVWKAKEAGATNERIVFDSPVKTHKEIQVCHEKFPGMLVNANSLEELCRYPENFSCKLGLRINPLVTSDAPKLFDVSTHASKFGVPISLWNKIIQECLKYPQIIGLHVHVGSKIRENGNNIAAVQKMVELATQINYQRSEVGIQSRIEILDIGGGIHFDLVPESPFSIPHFVSELNKIPDLFDNFQVVTEYGAFVHKHCSFVVSDIEYVTDTGGDHPKNVFIHVGADLFLRKIYSHLKYNYPCSIIYQEDCTKGKKSNYNIVGPLCFAGDVLYENIELPIVKEGDKFVMYNIGANTYSLWSKHCSREKPAFVCI